MAVNRTPRTPAYRLHKPTGQAYVEFDGRRQYLGRYDLPETQRAYHAKIAEWLANGHRLHVPPDQITVAELCDAYLEHAKVYYRDANGRPTSTLTEIKVSVNTMLALYKGIPAIKFGPVALRAVRQQWIDRGLSICTINSYVGNLKQMFKWATSHEMLPVEAHQALSTLPGLRRGRGVGKDPVARMPVPVEHVQATLPHLPRPLQGVVELLLLTGARPTEVLKLKRRDVDTNGPVWTAIVREHKTSYQGKQRRLFFGPRAQAVLKPFLLRMDDQYLFDPHDAIAARFEREREADDYVGRRDNQKPNPRKTARTISDHYTYTGLNVAVARVCTKHDIPKWTPYQLRHTAATTIEATADMETAKAILGHSGLDITAIYVHRDNRAAAAYAALHG